MSVIGLAAENGQLFQPAIQAYAASHPEAAGQLREQARAIWSRAWAANHTAPELIQHAGLARFSPVMPQGLPFGHHCSPHGPSRSPTSATSSFRT